MIEVKFQGNSLEEILKTMSQFAADACPAVAPPAAPAPAAPAAPPSAPAAPPSAPAPAAPAPAAPAPAAPAAPPAAPSAPSAEPVSAEQLQTLMQQTSARLSDGGAACFEVIKSLGVTGIAAMTDAQRIEAAAKVNAL